MKRSEFEQPPVQWVRQPSIQLEHSSPWKECPACQAALAALTLAHQTAEPLADDKALDRIAAILSGSSWDADCVDLIAQVVKFTGRKISDVGVE